jgi:uncharacterized protein YebE (UPF0316 family)
MSKLLLIIIIQLVYVPLLTLRTITMVKNLKVGAMVFGFLEALTYVFGLSMVLKGDSTILELSVYAIGFALGLFIGMLIEQKMAIGYSSIHVNINHENKELVTNLREMGYGVTIYKGEGKFGDRLKLDILTQRKSEKELISYVLSVEPDAFIIAYEPKTFRGGYLVRLLKK